MMDPNLRDDLIRTCRETFGDEVARQLSEKLDRWENRDKPPSKH